MSTLPPCPHPVLLINDRHLSESRRVASLLAHPPDPLAHLQREDKIALTPFMNLPPHLTHLGLQKLRIGLDLEVWPV